jgi:hypothetical protein
VAQAHAARGKERRAQGEPRTAEEHEEVSGRSGGALGPGMDARRSLGGARGRPRESM